MNTQLTFRFAKPSDLGVILQFIRELADYENMLDQVTATEELLDKWLFTEKRAEVLFACINDEPIGFALFFHNFSTFLGKAGIYLEDLYIRAQYRGKGYGKTLIAQLARIAVQRDCGRLEWWCLDWNQTSIDFYLSLGAKAMDEWTVYRIDDKRLTYLASLAVDTGL